MKYSILFLLAFPGFILCSAQEHMNKDSLLRLLPTAAEDTNKVSLLINIGQQYEGNNPELSKYYYQEVKKLSRQLNYLRGEIRFYTNYTFVLNMQGYYDSSLAMNLESVSLAKKLGDGMMLGKTLFNTGTSYRLMGDYENAVKYYEEGKKVFEPYRDTGIDAQGADILSTLYNALKLYRKALEYGRQAITGLKKTGNIVMLGDAYVNMGINYTNLGYNDSAIYCFRQALKIAQKTGDQNMEGTLYLNLGDLYIQAMDFISLKPMMEKALVLAKRLGAAENQVIAYKGLSMHYQFIHDWENSRKYADSALALAEKYNLAEQKGKVFGQLSNLSYSVQDMINGEYYARKSSGLQDSLLNETVQKATVELEKKYESASKENRIKKLETEHELQQLVIDRKNLVNRILVAGTFLLLLLGYLLYRNYRQKQRLQQKKIKELEAEKQLAATEAVLRGEEQERSRLAKDLHDGLGGMLSGIKYSFQTMRGNLIMTPENHQAFERSIDMLDSSIKEMRRVAHNMMPEVLIKFGLDTALHDFCEDVKRSGALDVTYQSLGMENAEIPRQVSITVYRIVQELLNNTMKHAGAHTALVQVSKSGDIINITVEDDGKGFDTAILNQPAGIGWNNIRSRVEYLKGKLDVQSGPGKGTSVNIEFKS